MFQILRLTLLWVALASSNAFADTLSDKDIPLPEELKHNLEATPDTQLQDTGELYQEFFKMIFMLGMIIFFLLFIMWFVKRMMNTRIEQMNVTSLIKVIERRAITPKTYLYIVEAGEKRIMFAESHNGVTVLSHLPSVTKESEEDIQ